jgi:hypothetical protein
MIAQGKIRAAALAVALVCSAAPAAAEDNEAKTAFKAMSDFLVAQKSLAVSYDATLEIVTVGLEKVALASSGTLAAERPDKIHATRTGGIADVELVYDGKVLSAYGKNLNIYAKLPVEGSLDDLIDKLRADVGLELPAADLLSSNPFDIMMSNVTEAKGLGEGVVRGQVCDHLAFRTADVDWQIWLAQGDRPFPCRFSITSKMAVHAPTYTIEFANWKSGADVATEDFQLKPAADAKEVKLDELGGLDEAPAVATEGEAQ